MADAIVTYSTGRGYVQCAFAMMAGNLRKTSPNDITFFLGFHMLVGFATELYLKAYLQTEGVSEEELRKPHLRHNLMALWEKCVEHGFDDPSTIHLVKYLNEGHRKYEFRYIERDTKYSALPLNIIFNFLNSLDNKVNLATKARESYGITSNDGWNFPLEYAQWRMVLPTGTGPK